MPKISRERSRISEIIINLATTLEKRHAAQGDEIQIYSKLSGN